MENKFFNRNKRKKLKRFLSLILVFMMVVALLPLSELTIYAVTKTDYSGDIVVSWKSGYTPAVDDTLQTIIDNLVINDSTELEIIYISVEDDDGHSVDTTTPLVAGKTYTIEPQCTLKNYSTYQFKSTDGTTYAGNVTVLGQQISSANLGDLINRGDEDEDIDPDSHDNNDSIYLSSYDASTGAPISVATFTVPSSTPTLSGSVSITGTKKYGETLTADTTSLTGTGDGTLSYVWKRGGSAISGATSSTYTLTADDIGQKITVTVTSDQATGSVTSAETSAVEKADAPAAPTGLSGVACTTSDNNDGKITGTTANMEYSTSSDFTSATACSATETTGLSNGTYYVRLKETSTTKAGTATTVTIDAYTPATIYIVNFYKNGHGTSTSAQNVVSGQKATEPTAPTADGWTFGGWYTESACTNAYDFDTPVTDDLELWAKWTENPSTISVTTVDITSHPTKCKSNGTGYTTVLDDGTEATNADFVIADADKDKYEIVGFASYYMPYGITMGFHTVAIFRPKTGYAFVAPMNETTASEYKSMRGIDAKVGDYAITWNATEYTASVTEGETKVTDTSKATTTTPDTVISSIDVENDITLNISETAAIAAGKDVNIFLEISDAAVSATDQATMTTKATASSYKIGKFIDIDLYSMIDGDTSSKRAITETANAIEITVAVPTDLINTNSKVTREYSIARLHDGTTDILTTTFDAKTGKLKFKSNLFSSYAILYKDTAKSTDSQDDTDSKSGNSDSNSGNSNSNAGNSNAAASASTSNQSTSGTSTSSATSATTSAKTAGVARTGDATPLTFLIVVMFISLCGLCGVCGTVVFKKKNHI